MWMKDIESRHKLALGELREKARGSNNASAFATEMRMQRYAGNILGSSQYMALRKKELVALMTAKKIATLWFTLSLANHHWKDLQNLFPTTEQLEDETDSEYMKRRKKIALQNYANNPAVVNEMFVERVYKIFLGIRRTRCFLALVQI
jgi:Helitron helicase-like domain at N-terminus